MALGSGLTVDERVAAALTRRDAHLLVELLAELPKDLPRNVLALADSWLTPQDLDIINIADATNLAERIQSGSLTAMQVMRAVGKRAVHAQQLTNCLTDLFLPQAFKRATDLDAHFARTGSIVGPLHGVPVSLKDQIQIKGRTSAIGWLAWEEEGKKAAEDALLVKILEDAGAIIYCHTTLPQAIMQLETQSFLGITKNPYDLEASSGGSSGGESALIAMKGSFMGVGTDIGGSVRSPAMACGIYALKPTTLRVPVAGFMGSMSGHEGIVAVAGPMTRSARDIDLFMSVLAAARPDLRDPQALPLTWAGVQPSPKPIRIGYFECDEVVQVHPPVRRAMQYALNKLKRRSDVELVPFGPVGHRELSELAHELYFMDGGKRIRDLAALSGEPVVPLTDWVISKPEVKNHTVEELWAICAKRNAARLRYAAHWQASGVDVVLCPAGPGTAPRHGESGIWWGYTNVWNLLDYPAVVFPLGLKSDAALDKVDASFTPLNELDVRHHALYNVEQDNGHPLALQVVGYRHQDEKVLSAVMLIENGLR